MKLYYSPTSPYARIARVIARETGLISQIDEEIAKTRLHGTDYFQISPVARIPALVVEGRLIADTRDIAQYFEDISQTVWIGEETPLAQTYRHIAIGLLDGLAVWSRESHRAEELRSDKIKAYEKERAEMALPWLNANSFACRDWNFAGVALACTFEYSERNHLDVDWAGLAPDLTAWITSQATRPSMQDTRAP